jgi:hypothetical protein
VDGSGQEEPKRDESPKDQSDTRCISRERSCHRDDILRLEFGAGRGRGKVTDVTPGGHRSIGTYTVPRATLSSDMCPSLTLACSQRCKSDSSERIYE